jgi:hypothetical protein
LPDETAAVFERGEFLEFSPDEAALDKVLVFLGAVSPVAKELGLLIPVRGKQRDEVSCGRRR